MQMSYELIIDYPKSQVLLRILRPFSFDVLPVCLSGPRWLSGDYWNVDSNIMKWGKHEAGVL